MSLGFSICDIVAVYSLASMRYSSCFRASDDIKRETESLDIFRQELNDLGTTLKELQQRLKELEIDDGTTTRRHCQSKWKIYVSQCDNERLKKDIALRVPKTQASFLTQRGLLGPDDASAFLPTPVEEPIGVPISDAAGSRDNRHIIYRSNKDLVAMRAAYKKLLEVRASNLSLVSALGDTGCERSTLGRALVAEGACTNSMTLPICYSYKWGDRVFCDNPISNMSTIDRSQDSCCFHGLDEGTIIADNSLSEARSSLNEFHNSLTKCNSANCIPSPVSSSEDISYGSSADRWLATVLSTRTWSRHIWSDDTPQKIVFFHSPFKRLGHAMSSVSLRTSKVLTLVSPMWFTSPARAEASHCGSQNDSVRLKTGPDDYGSWFQAVTNVQRDLLYLWTNPGSRPSTSTENNHPNNAEVQPSTILLACFLSTSCVALVAQAGRNDPYQTYIVGFCAIISSFAGALLTVNVQEFVFVYLFRGCLVGLAISLIQHRVGQVAGAERRGGLWGKASGDGDGGVRGGLGDEKS